MKCQHVGCDQDRSQHFTMYCIKHQMKCAVCDKDATLFTPEGHLCKEHKDQVLTDQNGYTYPGDITRLIQEGLEEENKMKKDKPLAQIHLYNQICLLFKQAEDKIREADGEIEEFEDMHRSTDFVAAERGMIRSRLNMIKATIGRVEKRVL